MANRKSTAQPGEPGKPASAPKPTNALDTSDEPLTDVPPTQPEPKVDLHTESLRLAAFAVRRRQVHAFPALGHQTR